MTDEHAATADSSAVRVALWRAMHAQIDAPPRVLEDEIGLQMAAPDSDWRRRPDMDPDGTRLFRASIVARARFVEDLVVEQMGRGVSQTDSTPCRPRTRAVMNSGRIKFTVDLCSARGVQQGTACTRVVR